MTTYYSGIGSRETPQDVLGIMEDAAFRLARIGCVLRSGKAGGADAAFQLGVQKYCLSLDKDNGEAYSTGKAEIYIPWNGFGTLNLEDWWDISLTDLNLVMPEQIEPRNAILDEIHPNPTALRAKRGAFALHSRNVHQVLGANILEPRPSHFCLFYASEDKHGNPKGGTATAVNLAKKHGVKCLNLNTPDRLQTLESFLQAMEKKRGVQIPQ